MPDPDLLELFVARLDAIGVRYLVTGSIAATLYGEPRATHDIDLVVMGTVARRGLAGLLMGNTAEHMIQELRCSVFALKPAGFRSPIEA